MQTQRKKVFQAAGKHQLQQGTINSGQVFASHNESHLHWVTCLKQRQNFAGPPPPARLADLLQTMTQLSSKMRPSRHGPGPTGLDARSHQQKASSPAFLKISTTE